MPRLCHTNEIVISLLLDKIHFEENYVFHIEVAVETEVIMVVQPVKGILCSVNQSKTAFGFRVLLELSW